MSIKTNGLLALAASIAIAGAAQAMPTADYVKAAGASDLYEKQSSMLVLRSTKDAGVRRFADMMIADHTKSTAKVKAAAMNSGMTPKPPMLNAEQRANIRKLTAASGTARDAMYVSQQKMAHQEALATHKDYAASGDKPALKAAAGQIVPVVEHHIQMLDAMPAM